MSVIIDGVTGEIIGTTDRKAAKQARPAFEGKTVNGKVVRTRVIPKPKITKVKISTPTVPEPDAVTVLRLLAQGFVRGGTLDAVAEKMLKEIEVKLGIRLPRHKLW